MILYELLGLFLLFLFWLVLLKNKLLLLYILNWFFFKDDKEEKFSSKLFFFIFLFLFIAFNLLLTIGFLILRFKDDAGLLLIVILLNFSVFDFDEIFE